MKNFDLIERFAEQHLGYPIAQARPVKLTGEQVIRDTERDNTA